MYFIHLDEIYLWKITYLIAYLVTLSLTLLLIDLLTTDLPADWLTYVFACFLNLLTYVFTCFLNLLFYVLITEEIL